MSDIDITDLLERITGCINNAEYDDEAETLSDAFAVIEAQAAEIERLRAAFVRGAGPDDPAGCPGDNGDSCCGYHEMCREALAGKAEQ